MKILAKYPTRQRPELFLKTLAKYISLAHKNEDIYYLVSYDSDDVTMTPAVIAAAALMHDNVLIRPGSSKSKIHACNRDIETAPDDWDVLLLISDDMFCQVEGWDEAIRYDMHQHFPDTNGCLWYNDSDQQRVCTLSVIGRKYYDEMGYIYHPSYESLWCDNEFTEVAQQKNKMAIIDKKIIVHEHPAWGGEVKQDELYKRNDRLWTKDKRNYEKRKALGFPK